MRGGWRAWPGPASPPQMGVVRRGRVLSAVLVLGLGGGCGRVELPDTPPVLLAEGTSGDQPWRLEGLRLAGEPCLSLLVAGPHPATARRCGIRRTPLRHLDPVIVPVGPRLLVFSPLAGRARRVRVDTADGAIRVDPARVAAGFPHRFFVLDLDPSNPPLAVRSFAAGGRAVVT